MNSCRVALALVVLLMLTGVAHADAPCEEWAALLLPDPGEDSGIGGTGRSTEDSGIGGTGRSEEEGGIGGTGMYGSITGFGSICVNGLRVRYDEATPVWVNGLSARPEHLRRGQVVWIEAHVLEGRLWAQQISALSAVVGSVVDVDSDHRHIVVSAYEVAVPEDAILVDEAGAPLPGLSSFDRGDVVDVSGVSDNRGFVVATRIQRRTARTELFQAPPVAELLRRSEHLRWLSLEGLVGEFVQAGRVRVAEFDVDVSAVSPEVIKTGARVWLLTQVRGPETLRAEQVRTVPHGFPSEPGSSLEPTLPKQTPPTQGASPEEPSDTQSAEPGTAPQLEASDLPELSSPRVRESISDSELQQIVPGEPQPIPSKSSVGFEAPIQGGTRPSGVVPSSGVLEQPARTPTNVPQPSTTVPASDLQPSRQTPAAGGAAR